MSSEGTDPHRTTHLVCRGLESADGQDQGRAGAHPDARRPSSSRARPRARLHACEIDFESGFWMDYPWAERLGELARENNLALSVHAPLFGWVGHLERAGRSGHGARRARPERRDRGGMRCGGRRLPPWLPARPQPRGRDRRRRRAARPRSRAARGQGSGRAFGIEVMGRVRDLGSLDDCVEISRAHVWVRPVVDFAHMHATSDGAFLERRAVPRRARARRRRPRRRSAFPHPFLRHRLREPQRDEASALRRGHAPRRPAARGARRFRAPATVISESPDERRPRRSGPRSPAERVR